MALSCASLESRPEVSPLLVTDSTSAETVLVRSMSETVKLPLVLRKESVSASVAVLVLLSETEIVGVSFCPLMVMTTSSVAEVLALSVTVIK